MLNLEQVGITHIHRIAMAGTEEKSRAGAVLITASPLRRLGHWRQNIIVLALEGIPQFLVLAMLQTHWEDDFNHTGLQLFSR